MFIEFRKEMKILFDNIAQLVKKNVILSFLLTVTQHSSMSNT